MKKWILALCLCITLAGCSSTIVPNNTKYIQESLLVECTADTPIPDGLDGEALYKALNEWQSVYNECRKGKSALIEAVRKS